MESSTHSTKRFIRFAIWLLLMLTACLVTGAFAPHRTVFVPCLFMVFFAPMVLLPIHSKKR
jgi:hypothetical protein